MRIVTVWKPGGLAEVWLEREDRTRILGRLTIQEDQRLEFDTLVSRITEEYDQSPHWPMISDLADEADRLLGLAQTLYEDLDGFRRRVSELKEEG